MSGTSKTGLQSAVRRRVARVQAGGAGRRAGAGPAPLELSAEVRPAPFVLRPFAGVYNPFPYGCSVLCNHPADCEARDVVRRAKEAWGAAGCGAGLAAMGGLLPGTAPYADGEPAVPEALFRRYTDTDSRPQTPAPTLASTTGPRSRSRTSGLGAQRGPSAGGGGGAGAGGGAGGRRCVTPDAALHALQGVRCGREEARPLLVLDLRRSHSQDALSWRGLGSASSAAGEPVSPSPAPSLSPSPPRPPSPAGGAALTKLRSAAARRPPPGRRPRAPTAAPGAAPAVAVQPPPAPAADAAVSGASDAERADSPPPSGQDGDSAASADEAGVRRRGKRRRRKRVERDGGREPAVEGLPDPQVTQVSALDASAEGAGAEQAASPAPVAVEAAEEAGAGPGAGPGAEAGPAEAAAGAPGVIASFLEPTVLRQLQRELAAPGALECEFDPKRRAALEEALRVRGPPPPPERAGPELRRVHRALQAAQTAAAAAAQARCNGGPFGPDCWLTAPRVASRRSARFQLPLDSRQLLVLTPMQYLSEHVALEASRKLLCRLVFLRHADGDVLPLERVETALREVLGAPAPAAASSLGGWGGGNGELKSSVEAEAAVTGMSFRTWCGAAALAERLAAATYAPRARDPPPEVEQVDLAALERRLIALGAAPRPCPDAGAGAGSAPPLPLVALLRAVRDA